MKRRKVVGFVGLLLAVAGAIFLLTSRDTEPSFQGKRLSDWLGEVLRSGGPNLDTHAVRAVRQIGTNGLPWLLRELDARDGSLKQRTVALARKINLRQVHLQTAEDRHYMALVGFDVLGPEAWRAVPELRNRLQRAESAGAAARALIAVMVGRNGDPSLSREASNALMTVRRDILDVALIAMTNKHAEVRSGGAAILNYCTFDNVAAVPALIKGTKDDNREVRIYSVGGLGEVTGQPVAAIPALIAALSDTNELVRSQAARSLGYYHRQAKTAVPYLMNARSDSSRFVRRAANLALKAIDPETAAAIPDLPDFKPLPAAPREAR